MKEAADERKRRDKESSHCPTNELSSCRQKYSDEIDFINDALTGSLLKAKEQLQLMEEELVRAHLEEAQSKDVKHSVEIHPLQVALEKSKQEIDTLKSSLSETSNKFKPTEAKLIQLHA